MKRTPLKRGGPIKRKAKLRAKRRSKRTPQQQWIAERPCHFCCILGRWQKTPSEPAHMPRVRSHGDYANLIPACMEHHADQHAHGIKTFEAKYGAPLHDSLKTVASIYQGMWESAKGEGTWLT